MRHVRHRIATLLSTLFVLAPAVVYGQTVTAVWDASPPSEQVTSYQVCVSTTSLACNVQLASVSPSSLSYTFSPTAGVLQRVAVRAINSLGTGPYSSEVSFSIPSFAAPANQTSYAGAAITPLNLSVTDPDGSPLHFTHTGLPVGLSLNATTGLITGTPSTAGNYSVTIFVNDGLVTVQRTFTWSVNLAVSVVSTAPSAGSGSQQTFALQYSDTLGVSDLATARVRFSVDSSTAAGTCTVSYSPTSGSASLQNDAGTAWIAGTLGSGTVSNSQCTVNLAGSSASTSGNTLTLNLVVTFTANFAGAKSIYMLATTNGGATTSWQQRGSWTVTAPSSGVPSTVSVTPGSGSGASGTFVLLYSDTAGATDLSAARVRFVPVSAGGAGVADHVCQATYSRSGNTVSLTNDEGTSSVVGSLGSGTISNSQCTINLAGSSVSLNGNNLTLTLAATFTGAFSGDKNVYMRATSNDGTNSAWVQRGTWTVPGSAGPGVPGAVSVTPGTGSGASGTFVMVYSDTAGVADLANARAGFVSTADVPGTTAGTCTVSYDPSGNALSLMDDAGAVWVAGTIGTGSLSNSQCSINLASSTAVTSGNNVTLSLAMSFTSSFAGTKNVYMRAKTDGGTSTGWLQRGTWTVAMPASGTPAVGSVSPNNGHGRSATFVMQYSDSAGALDLQNVRVRFVNSALNSPGDGVGTCTVKYNPTTRVVSLMSNQGTEWRTGTLGSGSLSNLQCTVNLATSSATVSGNNLTLRLAITFTQSFNGAKRIYTSAANVAGTSTGWVQRSTFLVQ